LHKSSILRQQVHAQTPAQIFRDFYPRRFSSPRHGRITDAIANKKKLSIGDANWH